MQEILDFTKNVAIGWPVVGQIRLENEEVV